MSRWLVAFIGTVTCVVSLGLLAAPAGALSTSTTAVTDNAAGVKTGGTFTFTAAVTGSSGTPTGPLTWAVTGPSTVSCGPSTLDTNGMATCTVTGALAGTYTATATYDGDTTYNGSISPTDTTATVGQATSTTTVTNNSGSVSTGGTLVFIATVAGPGGTPTGSVTWTGSTCTSSTTTLVAGVATCLFSDAQASTSYSVTATYGGDTNYSGSFGPDTASPGAANQATLIVTSTSGTYKTALTLTTSGGSGTGAVTYAVVNGTATGCANSLGSLTSTSAGTCLVTATKAADSNYNAAFSAQTTVTLAAVNQATLSVTSTSGTYKTVLTLTTSGGSGTGAVTYAVVNGTATGCANSLGSLTSTSAGTCLVTATKAADANYNPASSAQTTVTLAPAVPSAPTITNLPGQGTYGGGFTAAVVTTIGSGTTSVTSSTPAVCAASGLSVSYVGVGTCSLNAQVAASPNYTAATGGAQSFNIGRAAATTPVISNIPSPANEFAGFTVSLTTTGDGTMSVTSNTSNVCSVDPNGITVTFVGFGTCSLTPSVAQGPNHFSATGNPQAFTVKAASHGYWLVGSDGGIFSFGTAAFFGSTGNIHLQRPVVGITPTSTRNGYWLVASDGGIFSFGDSSFYGSIPGLGLHPAGSGLPNSLNAPIVGMVPILTGRGYFMVASDGGVFSFGDARFEGSCPGIGGCSGHAVTVIPDHSGNGYWVVTADGGVYAFGDAPFYGSGPPVAVPVVDAVATPNGNGYWLLYANGAVAAFGAATALGGPIGYVNSFNPAAAIFRTADGFGYWVAAARGDVFGYGSAPYLGGMAAAGLNGQIIAAFGF